MSRAESLSDILSKIEDHNKPIPYAPSPRVEEEIQEVVDTIAIQETIADSSSTSIVEDHFIKEGENIARAMEAKAAIYEKTAEEYRQIARDTRCLLYTSDAADERSS